MFLLCTRVGGGAYIRSYQMSCSPRVQYSGWLFLVFCCQVEKQVGADAPFLVFAFWFSILPLDSDLDFSQDFAAPPTVPQGPGIPKQARIVQTFNFLKYTCEASVTG